MTDRITFPATLLRGGDGLGKNHSGIVEPIKVKFKKDQAGVGHDPAEQFTFNWWDHVYKKAANNIVVENDKDGITVKRKATDSEPISNKRARYVPDKNMLYGRFVKSGTLMSDGLLVSEPSTTVLSSDSDEDNMQSNSAKDQDLLKICGGRTAHKGARHGMAMNGKLARLARIEEELTAIPKTSLLTLSTIDTGVTNNNAEMSPLQEKKKKKNKKNKKTVAPSECNEIEHSETNDCDRLNLEEATVKNGIHSFHATNVTLKSKRKKGKRKRKIDDQAICSNEECKPVRKSKKSSKRIEKIVKKKS
ncbi:PREDICTED: G patch domain-containing protein 4-like isoform X2 [Priapulus caudatus]|uniref:G patch domain-containing protein 4 n=1 Tax=Priapulus caudatus TaxID=37621 RepID=A0ABM1EM00_PRICU|nr:PREDICTED: G patch domain-containing protein 4-like isoform X2 [Priapulus caudatus]